MLADTLEITNLQDQLRKQALEKWVRKLDLIALKRLQNKQIVVKGAKNVNKDRTSTIGSSRRVTPIASEHVRHLNADLVMDTKKVFETELIEADV